MFRTLMMFHSKLPGAPKLNGESVLKAEFDNGSRILSLPGRTVRGLANVSLAIVDKGSRVDKKTFVTDQADAGDYQGGGRLIALIMPAGKQGLVLPAMDRHWAIGAMSQGHHMAVAAS